jgi:hypothetical protein
MWYWRRIEEISWTDRGRNEEVLHSQRRKEHSTQNKTTEGYMDWTHVGQQTAFESTLLKEI